MPGILDDALGDAAASESGKHTLMKAKGLMVEASQMPSQCLGQGFGSLLQEPLQVFQWSKPPFSMLEITGIFPASSELVTYKKKR